MNSPSSSSSSRNNVVFYKNDNRTNNIGRYIRTSDNYYVRLDNIGNELNSSRQNQFLELSEKYIGPKQYRPYIEYYENKSKRKQSKLAKWFKEKILDSIPLMGWYWIIPLYLIQALFLIFLETEIISNSILPVDSFLFDRVVGLVFGLLLGFTVSNVTINSKESMYNLVQNVQGKLSEVGIVFLAALKENNIKSVKKIEITRYKDDGSIYNENVTPEQLIIEQRHIIVTFEYLVVYASLSSNSINEYQITTLPTKLKNEFEDGITYKNNSVFLDRLLLMYNMRLDLLHESGALAKSTQVVTYNQSKDFSSGVGSVIFAGQDLNQPKTLIDLLVLMAWILLLYYPFLLFETWGFTGSMIIILVPNFLYNGLVQFIRKFNDPYELALKNKLPGVDINDMINEVVYNFDQELMFLFKQIESKKKI